MTPSSLSLTARKAYVRVFNGKASWKKRLAGAALVLGTPFMMPLAGEHQLSAERTPGLGDRQYQVLQDDVKKLGEDFRQINREYIAAYNLSQQKLTDPKNPDLNRQADAAQKIYSSDRVKMNRAVNDFRDRLIMSQGISEVDAVNLVEGAEKATRYTLFPKHEDTWRVEMGTLDECQNRIIGPGLARAGGPQAQSVLSCQYDALLEDGSKNFASGLAGMAGAGISLMLLSGLGGVWRKNIPEHEKRLRLAPEEKDRKRTAKAAKKNEFTIKIIK